MCPGSGRTSANVRPVSRSSRGPMPHPGPGLFDSAAGRVGCEGYGCQAYQALPVFDGNHAVVGSWVIDGKAAGVAVHEDGRRITHNNSRFVPRYFR